MPLRRFLRFGLRAASTAARWLCRGDKRTGIAMGLLALYYVLSWGPWQGKASGDGWFGYLYLRAIVFHHTLDMRTVAPEFLPFFGVMGPGGHMPNRCPIGPVFLWFPFYLLALGVDALGRRWHLPFALAPGVPRTQLVITGLGTLCIVLLGWRALHALVERHLGRTAATIAGMAAVLTTPVLWYTAHQPFYQHGPAFGMACLFLEHWDRTRGQHTLRRWIVLGLLGGAAAMMRLQEALFALLPALEAAYHLWRGPSRRAWLCGGAAFVLAFLIAMTPQLLAWNYYTGSPLHAPQVEPLRWSEPFLLTTLFSMRAGLFPWTPIAYAGLLGTGLVLWRRRAATPHALRVLLLGLLLVFALNVYVVACAWVLHGGYAFGARRLADTAPFLAIGLAALWALSRSWQRHIVLAFGVLCLCWNLALTELIRTRTLRSSGAEARAFSSLLEVELHAPRWLCTLAERVGYPFVQPAGWLFAAWHRMPPTAFEAVVGNTLLDRDGQWMQVMNHTLSMDRSRRPYVARGLSWPTEKVAQVTGPVRMLLPLFAKEPIVVTLKGTLLPGPVAVTINGQPTVIDHLSPTGFRFSATAQATRAGINVLTLDLPLGSLFASLDLAPLSPLQSK